MAGRVRAAAVRCKGIVYTHVHVISETVIVFMMSVASVVVQYMTELAQTCVQVWVSSCGH